MNENAATPAVPTIYVIDDDGAIRKALGRLLKAAGYQVEVFASAGEFLELLGQKEIVGCVVSDVRMPGMSGLDLQQALKTVIPPIPIIFLTGHGDLPMGVRAMKDGALDFLTKPVMDQDILREVAQALTRNAEERARHVELRKLRQLEGTLTPREREVMALVVRGWLNKQTAAELHTVEKTIKVHRARVMEKMQVTSLADLVVVAGKLGMPTGQANPAGSSATPAETRSRMSR